jgi:hypothetical protein
MSPRLRFAEVAPSLHGNLINGTASTVGMNERLVARLKRQQSQKDCAQVTADTQTPLLRAVSARKQCSPYGVSFLINSLSLSLSLSLTLTHSPPPPSPPSLSSPSLSLSLSLSLFLGIRVVVLGGAGGRERES